MRANKHTTTDEMWRNFVATAAAGGGDNRCADWGDNAMNGSLELSHHQLRQIHGTAKALSPSQRSDLMHRVKHRLGHNPSNDVAEEVIPTQLAINCPRSCVIQIGVGK